MYLNYTEYMGLGGTLDEATFDNLVHPAQYAVDYETFGRLKYETHIPHEVKHLMTYIIDSVHRQDEAMSLGYKSDGAAPGKYVTSQSNDGVSVSYNGMASSDLYALCEKETKSAIRTYLYGVKNSKGYSLLYRGLYCGE